VRNKWGSLGSTSVQQPSRNIKTIHSYFAHAPRLNEISVDSQVASLEPPNKHESEITHTEHESWICPENVVAQRQVSHWTQKITEV